MSSIPSNYQQTNSAEASPTGNNSAPDSESNSKRVTVQDVEHVQGLIERCIQMYLNMKETMNFLSARAGIEPLFTQVVWQKLEEENPEFFRTYSIRLALIKQINMFNELLECQHSLMNHQAKANIPSLALTQNETYQVFPVDNLPTGYTTLPHPQMPSANPQSSQTFQPMTIDSGRNLNTMDWSTHASDPADRMKFENPSDLAPLTPDWQFHLPPIDMSKHYADLLASDSTLSSSMVPIESFQHEPHEKSQFP